MNLRDADLLYLITDRRVTRRPLVEVVAEAVVAGVSLVQLREKDLTEREFLALAGPIREVTSRHNARLLLNGRAELAASIGADGVHLPSHLPIDIARDVVGDARLLGYSCHSQPDEIRRAVSGGVDFVTLSPVHPTASKPDAPSLGLDGFAALARTAGVPVFALGGIRPAHAAACLDAGAFGVGVVRGILAEDDVASAAAEYLRELGAEGRG